MLNHQIIEFCIILLHHIINMLKFLASPFYLWSYFLIHAQRTQQPFWLGWFTSPRGVEIIEKADKSWYLLCIDWHDLTKLNFAKHQLIIGNPKYWQVLTLEVSSPSINWEQPWKPSLPSWPSAWYKSLLRWVDKKQDRIWHLTLHWNESDTRH